MSRPHNRAQRERRREAMSNPSPWNNYVTPIHIPADITILDRDPSPCFRCEEKGPCRHRPWQQVGRS